MKYKPGMLLTLFFALVFLWALFCARNWPLRASILILVIGAFALVLCVVQLWQDLCTQEGDTKKEIMDVPEYQGEDSRSLVLVRTLHTWAWLAGLTFSIWVIGFTVALPLFTLVYSKIYGARWRLSIFLATLIFGLLYGFMELVMGVDWPEPLFFRLME